MSFSATQSFSIVCLLYRSRNMTRRCLYDHTLQKNNRLADVERHLLVSLAVQYETDGLDCQRGQTGSLDSFVSAKVVKTDYLAAIKPVMTG